MKHRLVCVSNRVQLPSKSATAGGLAVGVLDALKRLGGLWFGWSGELYDEDPPHLEIKERESISYALLSLQRAQFDRYYYGFANEALWPLLHFMPTKMRFRPEDWEAYRAVNEQFAIHLTPLLKAQDLVWVHDYQLIPLAQCLRAQGVSQPLGLFLHIPFPFFELLRALPTHRALLEDFLQYDVLGFQTQHDVAAFRDCIARTFGDESLISPDAARVNGRTVKMGTFPIGVDVDALQRDALRARRSAPVLQMMNSLHGRKLMIGVDRLDYSKGLVNRFEAYEQFLETFPDNRGRITYLQIAALSRQDIPSYVEIRRALEEAAGRTNGRFGMADWTPIRYVNDNVPRNALMGFLRAAEVGIVTPLRDGMNLVAKEYVAAQDPENPGVLILSTLTGAAEELQAALQVNPFDTAAVVNALQAALVMSLEERRERHAALLEVLRANDIHSWSNRFVAALQSVSRAASATASSTSSRRSSQHPSNPR